MPPGRRRRLQPLPGSGALLCLVLACAGAPPQPVPAPVVAAPPVRYEPLTQSPEGPEAVHRVNRERLTSAKEQFRDLDPAHWQGPGPWWLQHGARLVTYVDGQTALVAIGQADSAPDEAARRAAAEGSARQRASQALLSLLSRVARARGVSLPGAAEPKLRHAVVDAFFEQGGRTWALLLCDRDCLEASGRAARVSLAGAALQPGEP